MSLDKFGRFSLPRTGNITAAQRGQRGVGFKLTSDGLNYDLDGKKLTNLGKANHGSDAVNKIFVDNKMKMMVELTSNKYYELANDIETKFSSVNKKIDMITNSIPQLLDSKIMMRVGVVDKSMDKLRKDVNSELKELRNMFTKKIDDVNTKTTADIKSNMPIWFDQRWNVEVEIIKRDIKDSIKSELDTIYFTEDDGPLPLKRRKKPPTKPPTKQSPDVVHFDEIDPLNPQNESS